jgi:hypothetical protein
MPVDVDLDNLQSAYPEKLKTIRAAPIVLWGYVRLSEIR